MAICETCGNDMKARLKHSTCTADLLVLPPDGGPPRARVRYGVDNPGRCGSCGVSPGGFHHPGCDQEVCPVCERQVIGSCACEVAGRLTAVDAGAKSLADLEEESRETGRRLASEAAGFMRNAHQRTERPRRHRDALFWAAVEAIMLDLETGVAIIRGGTDEARQVNGIEADIADPNPSGERLATSLDHLAVKVRDGAELVRAAARYRRSPSRPMADDTFPPF